MLITHVQFRPTGARYLHVQATGPAFPTGYASGDIEVSQEAYEAVSLRAVSDRARSLRFDSSAQYAIGACSGDLVGLTMSNAIVTTVTGLVHALNAPSPSYDGESARDVSDHVKRCVSDARMKGAAGAQAADVVQEKDNALERFDVKHVAGLIGDEFCLNSEGRETVASIIESYIDVELE